MTTCIAAVTDEGKALILVADKMVGVGWVESELEISKMREIHQDWWVLFAGEDITPVFDIVDYTKAKLPAEGPVTVKQAEDAVKAAVAEKRMENAEALHLTPIGWDIGRFNREGNALPNFMELQAKINDYSTGLQLLVGGFDTGKAHIFTLMDYGETKGVPHRYDIPGFAAIGSGATGADYFMYYRHLGPNLPVREALYYALEAKYAGEQAGSVSASTDLFLARPGKQLLQFSDDETIEEKLIPICSALEPKNLRPRDLKVLNGLKELKGFPKLPEEKRKKRKKGVIEIVVPKTKKKKKRKKRKNQAQVQTGT
jgi:20S proteasome alpha/beta subunit